MADPAHDLTTVDALNGAWTSSTFSHTCSGADRFLKVAVAFRRDATQSVQSITYGGEALALVPNGAVTLGGVRVEVWYLVDPPAGANDVVVTLSASVPNGRSAASSFTGVDPADPLRAQATGNAVIAGATSAGPTLDVDSAAGELAVDALCARGSGTALTVTEGAGQTERYDSHTGQSSTSDVHAAGSDEAGAASVTLSYTLSQSREWALVGISLKPVPELGRRRLLKGPAPAVVRAATR